MIIFRQIYSQKIIQTIGISPEGYDTTANKLSGHIIDSLTSKPIVKAWVIITKDSKKFIDSTNYKGEFTFFKDGFSGKWQMLINDGIHHCLQINDINIAAGLEI